MAKAPSELSNLKEAVDIGAGAIVGAMKDVRDRVQTSTARMMKAMVVWQIGSVKADQLKTLPKLAIAEHRLANSRSGLKNETLPLQTNKINEQASQWVAAFSQNKSLQPMQQIYAGRVMTSRGEVGANLLEREKQFDRVERIKLARHRAYKEIGKELDENKSPNIPFGQFEAENEEVGTAFNKLTSADKQTFNIATRTLTEAESMGRGASIKPTITPAPTLETQPTPTEKPMEKPS